VRSSAVVGTDVAVFVAAGACDVGKTAAGDVRGVADTREVVGMTTGDVRDVD